MLQGTGIGLSKEQSACKDARSRNDGTALKYPKMYASTSHELGNIKQDEQVKVDDLGVLIASRDWQNRGVEKREVGRNSREANLIYRIYPTSKAVNLLPHWLLRYNARQIAAAAGHELIQCRSAPWNEPDHSSTLPPWLRPSLDESFVATAETHLPRYLLVILVSCVMAYCCCVSRNLNAMLYHYMRSAVWNYSRDG